MRDKIANEFAVGFENKPCEHCYARADKILALMCEGIGKVDNPFVRAGFNYPPECVTAFERCRQDILAMLQKTSMSSQKEVQ